MKEQKTKEIRLPNKLEGMLPIIVLLTIMISNYIFGWGQDPHIPVLIACVIAFIVGSRCGFSYKDMLAGGIDAVSQSLEAIIIILCVGCLIGSFEWAGIIPAVTYYGLQLISPALFLPLACILCALVAISLGSAWTVSATLGIAFMSIGTAMGINPALVAGMVLSGACTGDKFSPLSDSTNLAAGAAQTGLFDHIRAMFSTTFPSLTVAVIIYAIISLNSSASYDPQISNDLSQAIINHYDYMNPILLMPVVCIVVVAIFRVPAIASVLLISAIGCIFAVIFQGANFSDCMTMAHYGYEGETGNALCDTLINRGGMDSMLWTNNLVIIAVGFGGILQRIGAVESLLGSMIKKVVNPFQLIVVTIVTSMFCITAMCDQYLGIIIPASMYKDKYDSLGLSRNMLSRTIEDGGTLWSPLVPWSSCGAYHSSILGVSTFAYLPYCFMNILNPIYAIVTARFNRNIFYADGTYTNIFGKLKQGAVPEAPEEAHKVALAALAEIRTKNKAAL